MSISWLRAFFYAFCGETERTLPEDLLSLSRTVSINHLERCGLLEARHILRTALFAHLISRIDV